MNTASSTDFTVNQTHYYRIIEFLTVFGAISNLVICRKCKQDVSFKESGIRGLGFKLSFCMDVEGKKSTLDLLLTTLMKLIEE